MPSPINHRDISLEQTGRDGTVKYEHDVRVHLDTIEISAPSASLPYKELTTPGNFSKHELRIIDQALPKVKIFWDIECSFGGSDLSDDEASQYRDPATSTEANTARPSSAALWEKDVPGGWMVRVYMWKSLSANWTLEETITSSSDGMTWGLIAKKNGVKKYEGNLSIYVRSTTYLVLTALVPEALTKVYATGLVSPNDLSAHPHAAGGKKVAKKAPKTKAAKKSAKG